MVQFATTYLGVYVKGVSISLLVALLAMVGSVAIGTLGALGRLSRVGGIRFFVSIYTAIFRAVPPLVLLYLVYFGLPGWAVDLNVAWLIRLTEPLHNRVFTAIIVLAVNSGAYSTEILRAAIESVAAEQLEAARSLGMSYGLAMRRIVLPQAFRIAFPPLGNEFVAVLKGTSLVSVIGVVELMRVAQQVAANSFENLTAYGLAAVFYIVIVMVFQVLLGHAERKVYVGAPIGGEL